MTDRTVGDLDEVLGNLGVFRSTPDDLIATCPSGFRRVPITQGEGFYISLQGFAPNQTAYAHTHPDSEEWSVVLSGNGRAFLSDEPVPLSPGWSHVVAPSTGRGSWIDNNRSPSFPLRNPCGWRAALPTTTPGESGTGSSLRKARPLPDNTTDHSSESGWVWAYAIWFGAKPCNEM